MNYCEIPGLPHVLTPHLMALADAAILSYETVRGEQIAGLPHVSRLHNIVKATSIYEKHILATL